MPVLKGNLTETQVSKIKKNYTFLLNELDGRFLVPELLEEEVFDFGDKEVIEKQKSREERTDRFLTRLVHSGPYKAYDVFLKALRKHYPHVAEKLEKNEDVGNAGQTQEISNLAHTQKEIEERIEIIKNLQEWSQNECSNRRCQAKYRVDSYIPAPSFNARHLPAGAQNQEVEDCVHSLAQQTVLVVMVNDDLSKFGPDAKGLSCKPLRSGRVWRVQRYFDTLDHKSCPCNDCKSSATPRERWGEYIVLMSSHYYDGIKCEELRFVLGYDSGENISHVSVLRGVSAIRKNEKFGFVEVLSITHDADTSKRVEEICHRNNVNREKLLSKGHLFQKDKALAVSVSHPHHGPKHIIVEKWLKKEGNGTHSPFRDVYTAAAGACYWKWCGPVLLVDCSNASVTLHYNLDYETGKSCGHIWSL